MRIALALLGFVLTCLPALGQGSGSPRSLLMVWDSSAQGISQAHLDLVKQIRAICAGGQLNGAANFKAVLTVYDFNSPAQATALKDLGLSRSQSCPYISVVADGPNGLPAKVLWGVRYFTPDDGLTALYQYLGLSLTTGLEAPVQDNPIIDAGPLPPSGSLASLKTGSRVIRNGPVWLRDRKASVRFGVEDIKIIYGLEPRAKNPALSEWVAPYEDRSSFKTLISHALGEYYQVIPSDEQMLIGWVDNDGKSAWVIFWREKNGWRHVAHNDKTGTFHDNEDPFTVRWPILHGDVVQLKVSIPRNGTGWTQNHLIYEITVHPGN